VSWRRKPWDTRAVRGGTLVAGVPFQGVRIFLPNGAVYGHVLSGRLRPDGTAQMAVRPPSAAKTAPVT
jgi:hypothetical protein